MRRRLYVVSMFHNRINANRRQLWLPVQTLNQAIGGNANAQNQVITNVANIFRTSPDAIVWNMLTFTVLPEFDDGHII